MKKIIKKHLASKQPLRSDEILGLLQKCGFDYRQGKGSHMPYWHKTLNIRGVLVKEDRSLGNQNAVLSDCLTAINTEKKLDASNSFQIAHDNAKITIESSADLPDFSDHNYDKNQYEIHTTEEGQKWIISKTYPYLLNDITNIENIYDIAEKLGEIIRAEKYMESTLIYNALEVFEANVTIQPNKEGIEVTFPDDYETFSANPLTIPALDKEESLEPYPPLGVLATLLAKMKYVNQLIKAKQFMHEMGTLEIKMSHYTRDAFGKENDDGTFSYIINGLNDHFDDLEETSFPISHKDIGIAATKVYIHQANRYIEREKYAARLGYKKRFDPKTDKLNFTSIIKPDHVVEGFYPRQAILRLEKHIKNFEKRGINYFTDPDIRNDYMNDAIVVGDFVHTMGDKVATLHDEFSHHCLDIIIETIVPLDNIGYLVGKIPPRNIKDSKSTITFADTNLQETSISCNIVYLLEPKQYAAIPDASGQETAKTLIKKLQPVATILPGLPRATPK